MGNQRVDNQEFLSRVAQLFAASTGPEDGVYLWQKRVTEDSDVSVLFRASKAVKYSKTDKSSSKDRVKVSTVVKSDDLDQFWLTYTEAVKTGMGGLRRKDKKKKKAAKVKKDKA